jgi:hypothetical protein
MAMADLASGSATIAQRRRVPRQSRLADIADRQDTFPLPILEQLFRQAAARPGW